MLTDKTIEFKSEVNLHTYQGILFRSETFADYLSSRVKDRFEDYEGQQKLLDEFSELIKTDFHKEKLQEIFATTEDPRDWKIGECLAECYLEDFHNSFFPYNSGRDSRKSNASLPGADLVGFSLLEEEHRFTFGEVKTSSQNVSPPNVIYGKTGLIFQLETLKSDKKERSTLIKWLAYKIADLPDEDNVKKIFKEALTTYLNDSEKIKLVGVLVRDTQPNDMDYKNRFSSLIAGVPGDLRIDLLALYLPVKIDTLKNNF